MTGEDPQAYAADLQARAQTLYAQGITQQATLNSLAATTTAGSLTVTVGLGGRLTHLVLDPRVAMPSAATLGMAFAQAYWEACRLVTSSTATHSGGLHDTITALGPPPDPPHDTRPTRGTIDLAEPGTAAAVIPDDDEFDQLLATLDDAPDELTTFLNHPLYQRLVPASDPHQWQQELTDQLKHISARSKDLANLAATTTGEYSDQIVSIVVTVTGRIENLSFRPAVTKLSAEKLATTVMTGYQTAVTQAEQSLRTVTSFAGIPTRPRPTTPITIIRATAHTFTATGALHMQEVTFSVPEMERHTQSLNALESRVSQIITTAQQQPNPTMYGMLMGPVLTGVMTMITLAGGQYLNGVTNAIRVTKTQMNETTKQYRETEQTNETAAKTIMTPDRTNNREIDAR